MTQRQQTIRKERHIAVDLLLMCGTGIITVAYDHHSWSSGVLALVMIVVGLFLDRSNALDEDENHVVNACTRLEPHTCRVNGPCNGWPKDTDKDGQ